MRPQELYEMYNVNSFQELVDIFNAQPDSRTFYCYRDRDVNSFYTRKVKVIRPQTLKFRVKYAIVNNSRFTEKVFNRYHIFLSQESAQEFANAKRAEQLAELSARKQAKADLAEQRAVEKMQAIADRYGYVVTKLDKPV